MTLGLRPRVVLSPRLLSQLVLVAGFLAQLDQLFDQRIPEASSSSSQPASRRTVQCQKQEQEPLSSVSPALLLAPPAGTLKWIPLASLASPTTLAPSTSTLAAVSTSTTGSHFQYSKQQQQQQAPTLVNLTQLILDRFGHVFGSASLLQSPSSEPYASTGSWLLATSQPHNTTNSDLQQLQTQESQFSPLETRANLVPVEPIATASDTDTLRGQRKFFRVQNRVFSRTELPSTLRRSQSSSSSSSSSSSRSGSGAPPLELCAPHIGCIDDLPNFPSLLKLKLNVSASFTIYSRDGPKSGSRIAFEPLVHHQLQEQSEQSEWDIQQQFANSLSQAQKAQQVAGTPDTADTPKVANKLRRNTSHRHYHYHSQRQRAQHRKRDNQRQQEQQQQQQQSAAVAASAAAATAASAAAALLATTASSWLSAIKIARTQELPYDLAAIEQAKFNASQETRIIIGGYFAKEDEEWIDELVRQWLLLEPNGNVIKVSWQDSNRGLYHTAAHNSRIVGRQLSLFLHYLDQLYSIDLDKFHLVGHSLGAHIAGFVGADNEGQIARITGLDPAGPIFIELNASMRLDPSDAKFVDVLHTNGGTITKGALGLSTPLGHVDYYCNGGSLQPGCYFSSVTKSIMDPVERIACNHRRSYRYFTELIKLAVAQTQRDAKMGERADGGDKEGELEEEEDDNDDGLASFPRAFLFRGPKLEADLARLVHPELSLLRQLQPLKLGESLAVDERLANDADELSLTPSGPPLTRRIEFHLMRPAERSAHQHFGGRLTRGLYFFRTRPEAPFFGSKQYALTLRLNQQLKRKIALMVKINSTLVAELELDELSAGENSFLFVPNEPKLIDQQAIVRGSVRAPDLWLMWRQRSFNLLLSHHQSELQLHSIELTLLDNYGQLMAATEEQPSGREQDSGDDCESKKLKEECRREADEAKRKVKRRKVQARKQQVFTIRYGNNIGPPNRQRQHEPSGATATPITVINSERTNQSGDNSSAAILARQLDQSSPAAALPILLLRNQWHKFSDGRPMIIESQVL